MQKHNEGVLKVDITELSTIEAEDHVAFQLEPGGQSFSIEGDDAAIDRALTRLTAPRADIAALLRKRDGSPDPIVKRVIATNVLTKEVYRSNYRHWYSGMSRYYWPTAQEEEAMFNSIEEGWQVIFDFAMSVTCRLPDGRLVAVDRKGKIVAPSPYSPAMMQKVE
jgi:hypothetical protein